MPAASMSAASMPAASMPAASMPDPVPSATRRSAGSLRAAQALADQQQGLVSARQLDGLGVTPGRLAHRLSTGISRAVVPGVYLFDSWLHAEDWRELPLETRVRAAHLLHGPESVFCLDTVARLRGIGGVGLDNGVVQVQLPPGSERHQVPGINIHPRLLGADESTTLGPHDVPALEGIRVTTSRRTVLDLVLDAAAGDVAAPLLKRRERAVQILDSALNKKLIVPGDFREMRHRAWRRRGAAISRPWWGLADGRAQSPLETTVRLIATDAKMPPDELQYVVRDRFGQELGEGDMAWLRPGRRTLVGEVDGREPHDTPTALYRDRYRANDFLATGEVDIVRFTAADCRRPAYIVSTLRRLLADS